MSGVLVDAYGGRKTAEIMRETWGHLDAPSGVKHDGYIVFAEGAYGGERFVLECDFAEAGFGPWFYEGIHDWLWEQTTEPGSIYRFDGYYQLTERDEHEFVGQIKKIETNWERKS